MSSINYPPEEIFKTPKFGKKNFEHIILWLLYNNDECQWSDFTEKPLELRLSTLSKYLSMLKGRGYVDNYSRGHYKITPEGKKRFHEISRVRGKKKKLSYPPKVIVRRRNYDHWILWMVYNNSFCKWSDFLEEPLSINQSSLSKNMNLLLDKGLVIKENKEYRITRSGKVEYSRMLQDYDLDRQSILNEESKRIEEITKKTIQFFENYSIKNEDIQFRFLNNILRLDYARVKSMLTNEEDFNKILLFLSINHPNQYPDYISTGDFSNAYGLKNTKLQYYIDEIVENNIYPIRFFKLTVSQDENYYFQSDEPLEIMLRAITEKHITKSTYLNKLFSRSFDLSDILSEVLDSSCRILFNENLRNALKNFLPQYINYLAYKIEEKVELKETYDKLEGIIWQDMIGLFQTQKGDELKDQYEEKIKEIDKEIEENPEKIELYNSKISILLYYEQLDDVLTILDDMLDIFPKNEIDIKMKKASVLRRLRNLEEGLDIIDELLEKYPKNNDLLNYKVYWLQYLNRKEEAIELIQSLVDKFPDNGTYNDTYGEILMYYEEYEHAIEKFLKTIEVASDEWYINQTYIKLGLCYKELQNFDSAIKNFRIGKELTEKSVSDAETKQKWLTIAELFLAEIQQIEEK
ncbi:MAG: tetratricopeptide repeat protein [Promethearchaeota archaeon]|nr:MAG: tetratricopeptide repeat protein [Candidatus Lokiarchaeota archaeon]